MDNFFRVRNPYSLKRLGYRLFVPDFYVASTIKDFLDNKLNLVPTKKFKFVPRHLKGLFEVFFKNSGIYYSHNEKNGEFYDLNNSLELIIPKGIIKMVKRGQIKLEDKMIIKHPIILYNPFENTNTLRGFKI